MRKIQLLVLFALVAFLSQAQHVVVAEDENANADASSILDIQSVDKGVLLPRLTEVQRQAITSPATGLMVYQTDEEDGFYFYNGAGWLHLIDGVEEDPEYAASPAASITDAGSGQVISDSERSNLENALITGNGTIDVPDTVQINSVLLFPRMTISERNMLSSPEGGSMIYQTDNTPGLRVYDGSSWNLVHQKVAYLSDVRDRNVKSGSNVVGIQTRVLSMTEGYTGFFPNNLNNNVFTLEPGTYLIEGSAPTYRTGRHQIRLYDVTKGDVATTDDAREFTGTSAYSRTDSNVGNRSFISGIITIEEANSFRLEHYTAIIQASEGLVLEANGGTEIYSTLKITKIAD